MTAEQELEQILSAKIVPHHARSPQLTEALMTWHARHQPPTADRHKETVLYPLYIRSKDGAVFRPQVKQLVTETLRAAKQATWKEAADELGILASNQIGNRKGLYTGIKLMEAAFRRRTTGGTP